MKDHNKGAYHVQCFLCDYWYLLLLVIGGLIFAIWFKVNNANIAIPQAPVEETSTPVYRESPMNTTPITPTNSPELGSETDVMAQPPTSPSPIGGENPEFIIAFVPIEWNNSIADFETVAAQHFSYFLNESGIDNYFDMDIRFVNQDDSLKAMSDNIVTELILYGTSQMPADRYVGLTTVDMNYEGDYSIAGWTMGDDCQGVIAEYFDEEITAHELGHTFGLCDEYSMKAWEDQNEHYINKCPNQLDASCEMDEICVGVISSDGSNSIMGVAGLIGEYSYNDPCKNALASRFASMRNANNP